MKVFLSIILAYNPYISIYIYICAYIETGIWTDRKLCREIGGITKNKHTIFDESEKARKVKEERECHIVIYIRIELIRK
jgi:hypothetical protein